MSQLHGEDRDPVEVLAEQFLEQQRCGNNPSIVDYAAQYPEFSREIRELFPAVLALERLKSHTEQPSAGRASLGATPLERLGEFRLLREIGRGGMGVVYEALHESLGRHVAVKVLPQQGAKQFRAFQREARTAARLHHNNIVPLFGVGEQDGFHYIVMQLIRGVDLEAVLATLRHQEETANGTGKESGGDYWKVRTRYKQDAARLADSLIEGACVTAAESTTGRTAVRLGCDPSAEDADTAEDLIPHDDKSGGRRFLGPKYWRQVAEIARQAAEALQYAHSHRTLHRDVKPANLILDSQGVVWITDFGLAKAMDEEHASQTTTLGGTLRYMAPEQFSNQCDNRSDIYSLGLTVYELLTLHPAFSDSSRSALIRKITEETPTLPSRIRRGIPRDLEAIVMKAIAKDPSQRYSSAGELANDVARYLNDLPVVANPMPPLVKAWRWTRRNRMVAALGTATAAFLVTTAIFAVLQSAQRTKALETETNLRAQAEIQRVRAEANLRLAAEAFEDVFRQVTGGVLPGTPADVLDESAPDPSLPPGIGKREETILVELLAFYDQFARQNADDLRWQYETARAFRRVCEIQFRLGHDQDADLAGQRGLTIYQRLVDSEPNKSEYIAGVAATRNLLANIAWESGRADIAFRESRQVWQSLSNHPNSAAADASCRIELARAYNRYAVSLSLFPSPRGSRSNSGERRTDAKEYLQRSLEIVNGLLEQSPESIDYGLTLAESYRCLWGLETRRKQTSAAHVDREQAIQVLENLVEKHPDEPECQFMLAEVYLLPFRFSTEEVESTDSAQQTARAVEIASQLVKQFPQVPKHRAVLAQSLCAAARVSERTNQLSEARRQLERAVEIQQALVQERPNRQRHQFELVRILNERVRQSQSSGQDAEQLAALEALIQVIESFPSSSRSPSPFVRSLGKAYADLAKVLREQGDLAGAEAADKKAQELAKQQGRPPSRVFNRPPQTASAMSPPIQEL